MTAIASKKLGEAVGAEVVGVDRERVLDDEMLPAACLDLLETHGVLVFRGLHLDDDAQVAFCRKLGDVVALPGRPVPEVTRISLDPERSPIAEYTRGTFDWHIDGTTDDVPIKATVLTAHAVAESGGDTEFASTYVAYDALSKAEKEHCEDLRVVHSFAAHQQRVHPDATPEQVARWHTRLPKVHPLVWHHRSGRRSLVLGATASHVVDMDVGEGRALLDDLLARSTAAERTYRHWWSVGDTVIWDNRGVLHRVHPYDASSPRDMHRTTLMGDEPIEAARAVVA